MNHLRQLIRFYLRIVRATAKTPMMRTLFLGMRSSIASLFRSSYSGKVMQATGKGRYGAE